MNDYAVIGLRVVDDHHHWISVELTTAELVKNEVLTEHQGEQLAKVLKAKAQMARVGEEFSAREHRDMREAARLNEMGK